MREGKLRLEGPCKEHEGDCYKQRKTLYKAPGLGRAWYLANKNGKGERLYHDLDLREKAFSFLPFSIMLAVICGLYVIMFPPYSFC